MNGEANFQEEMELELQLKKSETLKNIHSILFPPNQKSQPSTYTPAEQAYIKNLARMKELDDHNEQENGN